MHNKDVELCFACENYAKHELPLSRRWMRQFYTFIRDYDGIQSVIELCFVSGRGSCAFGIWNGGVQRCSLGGRGDVTMRVRILSTAHRS